MSDLRSLDNYDYERWARIKAVFAGALRVPPDEREAWVRRSADDAIIQNNVLKLLAHHHTADLLDDDLTETPMLPPAFDSSTLLAGRFQIIRLIGAGGMGEVYEARDNHTGDTLAIKALRPELAGDRAFVARFLRELQVSRRIAHPNVCRVLEFYPSDDAVDQHAAFFTMEMLTGETLARRIARCGRMTPAEALPILRQIAAGLAEVHMLSIIHRDLKPANIMLVPDEIRGERAVVMDFGLARTNDGNILNTRTGPFLGTPVYMAPEQFKRGPLTGACDVYAFGITIVEMLTGRSQPPALSGPIPGLQPGWNEVLKRCLDPSPENRPACALEVVKQLELAEAGGPRLLLRRKPWMIAAAAAVCLGVCAVPILLYANRHVTPTGVATKLTFENLALDPAASADGKLLFYTSDRWQPGRMPGVRNIWSQSLETGERHPVTSDNANEEQPAVSPDGKLVAYRSTNDDCVYVKPVSGGDRRLLVPWGRNPQFSPDGRWIAYWTGQVRDYATGRIYVVATAGGTPRQLAANLFDARLPVWSKSGLILFRGIRTETPKPSENLDWWIINPADGIASPTGLLARANLLGLAPTDHVGAWDSREVIFAARAGSGINLWRADLDARVGRATSDPERLTRGGERETTPVLLGNGNVAYAIWHATAHVWRISTQTGAASPVTGGDLIDVKPSVSSAGRFLVFSVRHGNGYDICRADLKIGGSCQESFPGESTGVLSPDGQTVAVLVNHRLDLHSAADHTVRNLPCPGCGDIAGWTPDGNVVVRCSGASHETTLEVADIRTGTFKTLFSAAGLRDSVVSPDGRSIAYALLERGEVSRIYVQSLTGSAQAAPPIALTPDGLWSYSPAWSADGKQIYYCSNRGGFPRVWRQIIDAHSLLPAGPPHELSRFTSGAVSPQIMAPGDFALVRGGDWLFLSVGLLTGNIWTMKID